MSGLTGSRIVAGALALAGILVAALYIWSFGRDEASIENGGLAVCAGVALGLGASMALGAIGSPAASAWLVVLRWVGALIGLAGLSVVSVVLYLAAVTVLFDGQPYWGGLFAVSVVALAGVAVSLSPGLALTPHRLRAGVAYMLGEPMGRPRAIVAGLVSLVAPALISLGFRIPTAIDEAMATAGTDLARGFVLDCLLAPFGAVAVGLAMIAGGWRFRLVPLVLVSAVVGAMAGATWWSADGLSGTLKLVLVYGLTAGLTAMACGRGKPGA